MAEKQLHLSVLIERYLEANGLESTLREVYGGLVSSRSQVGSSARIKTPDQYAFRTVVMVLGMTLDWLEGTQIIPRDSEED